MEIFSTFQLTDPATSRLAVATVFTFAAVFLFVLGVSTYIRTRLTFKRRVVLNPPGGAPEAALGQGWFENARSLRSQSLSATSALLSDVERGAARDESEASKIKRDMLRAGFFSQRSVYWYQVLRAAFLIAGGLLGYLAYGYYSPDAAANSKILAAAVLAAVGFLLPSRFVAMRQKRLIRDCREGFPDFIDLLIVCAEAGLGPRAAIDRLSREISNTHPILGAHLYLASLEIRAGSSLHQALFNLSRRIQVDEAATLATLLEQTEQLGTSVTDALRVYSDEMRDRRLVRAEEKAHALPAKLVLPLGLFVFPVILVVILLPAVIRIKGAGF
ncbi:MAG: type II secretion system F family protein [Rhodomicrobium sp.]